MAVLLLGLVFARPFVYSSLFGWEIASYGVSLLVVYLLSFVMIPDSEDGIGVGTRGHDIVLYVCVVLFMLVLAGMLFHVLFLVATGS